ncbi:MAG: hypothetical protein QM750_10740 [Rubrivivax sp.]
MTAAAAPPAPVADDGGGWTVEPASDAVLLRRHGVEVKRYPARSLDGARSGRPAALHHLAARRSFLLAFDGLAEWWELSLDPQAEPIFNGLVHDYRMAEAIAEPGYLGLRRTVLPEPLAALAAGEGGFVLARGADAPTGRAVLYLVQLDVRRAVARFELDADPDVPAARAAQRDGRALLMVPDRRGGPEIVVDLRAGRLR